MTMWGRRKLKPSQFNWSSFPYTFYMILENARVEAVCVNISRILRMKEGDILR